MRAEMPHALRSDALFRLPKCIVNPHARRRPRGVNPREKAVNTDNARASIATSGVIRIPERKPLAMPGGGGIGMPIQLMS